MNENKYIDPLAFINPVVALGKGDWISFALGMKMSRGGSTPLPVTVAFSNHVMTISNVRNITTVTFNNHVLSLV